MAGDGPSRRSLFHGAAAAFTALFMPSTPASAAPEPPQPAPSTSLRSHIDRAFRQYRRYTGDGLPGEPVNAPLPIGDPKSGPNEASNELLREELGAWSDRIEQASARVTSAADGIANVNAKYRSVADLLRSTEPSRGTGAIWEAQGFRYVEAPAGAATPHLTLAGGIKLYVQPLFSGATGGTVLPEMVGAVGDGKNDDTAAINAAATIARASKAALLLQSALYAVTGTLDFTDIAHIDARSAMIAGNFTGMTAIIIGARTGVLPEAMIWLKVRNATGSSIVDGTVGIKCLGLRSSTLVYYCEGFDTGLYFDGASGTYRNWLDCEFRPLRSYNNGTHVHIHVSGKSYFIGNRFSGGSYYLGTNQKKAGRGTFKLTISDSAAIAQVVVNNPEIGLDGNSQDPSYASLVYAEIDSINQINDIIFRNARYEEYGKLETDPYFVNIAKNPPGGSARLDVDIELLAASTNRWLVFTGENIYNRNSVNLRYTASRSPRNNVSGQKISLCPPFPYQTEDAAFVPGRILYDGNVAGLSTPVFKLTSGILGRTTRAIGDGQLITSSPALFIGLKYKKVAGQTLFLAFPQSTAFTVICYDPSGIPLRGTSPWYAQSTSMRSITLHSVGLYQGIANWLWLHPDVDSFYLAFNSWTSGVRRYVDIQPDVRFGDDLILLRDQVSAINNVVDSQAIASYFPGGMAFDGEASNGYRCTFDLRTTAGAAASAAATSVKALNTKGISKGDRIGIELDATLIQRGEMERQWHHTEVASVSEGTIGLSDPLPDITSAGRRICINRWVPR